MRSYSPLSCWKISSTRIPPHLVQTINIFTYFLIASNTKILKKVWKVRFGDRKKHECVSTKSYFYTFEEISLYKLVHRNKKFDNYTINSNKGVPKVSKDLYNYRHYD